MMAAVAASSVAAGLMDGLGIVVIGFFVAANTATAALLVAALPELWRHWDLADEEALAAVLTSGALPTVSVVVTGRADRAWTVDAIHSLLALHYPRHEVVLVHDAADDTVLAALVDRFDLYQVPPAVLVNVPTGAVRGYYRSRRHGKLFVIDKPHLGHADDLNAALNASRFPYVLTMDVGTRLVPDALLRLMRPFLLGERVASVSAAAHVAREPVDGGSSTARGAAAWLGGAQAAERRRETFAQLGWNRLGGALPAQNGVLLHRRDHLLEIDGYRSGVADPELDMVVRLRAHLRAQQQPDAGPAVPDAVAWTLALPSAGAVARRAEAVQRGQVLALRSWRSAPWRAGDGPRGYLATARLAGAAAAPLLELLGYMVLVVALVGGTGEPFVPLFLLAVPGYALLLALWAVALEALSAPAPRRWRGVVGRCTDVLMEQLGYRQWLAWHRLRATWESLLGRRSREGERLPPPAVDAGRVAAERAQAR